MKKDANMKKDATGSFLIFNVRIFVLGYIFLDINSRCHLCIFSGQFLRSYLNFLGQY